MSRGLKIPSCLEQASMHCFAQHKLGWHRALCIVYHHMQGY